MENQNFNQGDMSTIIPTQSQSSSGLLKFLIPTLIIALIVCGSVLYIKQQQSQITPVNPVVAQNNNQLEGAVCGDDEVEIKFISTQSGPAGSMVEIGGCGFSGFEGDKDVWIENEKGEKGIIHGDFAASTNEKIVFQLASPVCTKNTAYTGDPCPQWMELVPGKYKIYVEPLGKKSNEVRFVITPLSELSSGLVKNWKIYTNSQYGFGFKYPQDWTLEEDLIPSFFGQSENKKKDLDLMLRIPHFYNSPTNIIAYSEHPASRYQSLSAWIINEQIKKNIGISREGLWPIQNISVNGREAYIYQQQVIDGPNLTTEIFIKNKDTILKIQFDRSPSLKDAMDVLLSTFKFLN